MDHGNRLGRLIATGRTAEVFDRTDGTVLKLLRPDFPESLGVEEARAAARVTAVGLAAPQFLGTERVEGRLGMVYERVDGPSMLEVIVADPGRASELATTLAELHAEMHAQAGAGLPDALAGIRAAIGATGATLGTDDRDRALQRLGDLQTGSALIHGDLHPGNVLMTADGPRVIDWLTAAEGPPAADVARTLFLLTGPELTDEVPRSQHAAVQALRHAFAEAYLARYRGLRQLELRELDRWRLPILVARAAERVAGEAPLLRALIASAS